MAVKNSWEISLEDQTPTLSVTLPRKSQTHTHTHPETQTHIYTSDLNTLCACAGWTTWLWTVTRRWTTVRWTRYSSQPVPAGAVRAGVFWAPPSSVASQLFSIILFWRRQEVFFVFLFQGNKKGPLGRWDFDTQEEYSDYMNNKEALPKWVFPLSSDKLYSDNSVSKAHI